MKGRHLFDVSSTVLVMILNCEWIGEEYIYAYIHSGGTIISND